MTQLPNALNVCDVIDGSVQKMLYMCVQACSLEVVYQMHWYILSEEPKLECMHHIWVP